jgi:hypothetical protein
VSGSNHIMEVHSMHEGMSKSLAEECMRLCSHKARTSRVEGNVKREKEKIIQN